YELDEGDYIFYAAKNSHDRSMAYTINNATEDLIKESPVTGEVMDNVFTDPDDDEAIYNYSSISPTMTIMSREDFIGTFPQTPTLEERDLTVNANATNPMLDEIDNGGDFKITKQEI